LHHAGGEPPLPQMPTPTFTEIDSSSIATVCLAYSQAQSIPIGGDNDHVDVIGHKAVSPYGDAVLSAPLGHQSDIETIVLLGEKGLLATVAPLGYMMRILGYNDSCDSGHEREYKRSRRKRSRVKYDVPGI